VPVLISTKTMYHTPTTFIPAPMGPTASLPSFFQYLLSPALRYQLPTPSRARILPPLPPSKVPLCDEVIAEWCDSWMEVLVCVSSFLLVLVHDVLPYSLQVEVAHRDQER
jgi:hypothetical protein